MSQIRCFSNNGESSLKRTLDEDDKGEEAFKKPRIESLLDDIK